MGAAAAFSRASWVSFWIAVFIQPCKFYLSYEGDYRYV